MTDKNIYFNECVSFEFVKSKFLPKEIPISTPLTFSFVGMDLVLAKKESGNWDILGGKMELEENWIEALKRESLEEAGVIIDNIEIVGYFLAINKSEKSLFPKKSILPVTISYVESIDKKWIPRETLERNIFKKKEVISLLNKRADSRQIISIYEYVFSMVKDLDVEYILEKYPFSEIVPTTQVMVFCQNDSEEFCIVRDEDESHYSLPGGGCDLGEEDLSCARRELFEEAQIKMKNPEVIGAVLINFKKNGSIMSKIRHVRVFGLASEINEFTPLFKGFEVVERKFIPLNKLVDNVPLLQNPSGKEIVTWVEKK